MGKKILYLMKGLPASGKSTYAKQFLRENASYKRINRDSLRAMVDDGQHSTSKEKHIKALEVQMADYFFAQNFNVIIDDTNLSPSSKRMWEDCAKKNNAELHWRDFTDVSVEECIARDLKRLESVGERVIRKMYHDFLAPAIIVLDPVPGAPEAIIVDLDGTLALYGDANPYDRDFSQDRPNSVVLALVNNEIAAGTTILFTSGRKDTFVGQTYQWLCNQGVCRGPHALFMRCGDDGRKDAIVKEEIYHTYIQGKYTIKFVLDDRNQVVEVWRRLGLVCLQVADGNF